MKKKSLLFFLFFVCIVTSVNAQAYPGTNFRGQVLTPSYGSLVAMRRANVSLFQYQYNKWINIANSITNDYGFYFFYGVPVGDYYLQINGHKNYPIRIIAIDYRYYQFQDIPVLYF